MEVGSPERRAPPRQKERRTWNDATPDDVQATGTLRRGRGHAGASARGPGGAPSARLGRRRRARLTEPGKYLAYEESRPPHRGPVSREWTRIGRSLAADVRFDDATVSRRHALVVCQADGVSVLDDRSLNGVYVNGRRVEWSPLADGDEIVVGRHTLFSWTPPVGDRRRPGRGVAAE